MRIEEAIKQTKPFESAHHRAVVNLFYTSNWARDHMKQVLATYKITNQQYNVLRILNGAPEPISTSAIRERLLDKMSDTSRLVDRLAQKKLVIKRPCPTDKRLVDVALSPEGKKILTALHNTVSSTNNELLNLSAEEADQLSRLLDKARG